MRSLLSVFIPKGYHVDQTHEQERMYPQLRWLLLGVPFYAIKTTVGRVIPEPLCLNNSGSDNMKNDNA